MLRAVVLLLLCCAGCTWFSQEQGVLITSTPAGAHVFIDGNDMGATTPVKLAVAGSFGTDHVLTLKKRGFRDEQRLLTQFTEGYSSMWVNGAATESEPTLPIFWTAGDLLIPFGVRSAIVPGEVYVKLYRDDEPLLGFEALQSKQRMGSGGVTH